MWKYIGYICKIILKNKEQYTDEKYYVRRKIRKKELDWFPKNKKEEDKEKNKDKE